MPGMNDVSEGDLKKVKESYMHSMNNRMVNQRRRDMFIPQNIEHQKPNLKERKDPAEPFGSVEINNPLDIQENQN